MKAKIQEVITQYRALGWTDVRPLDMGGNRLPRIICWSEDDTFSIHIELHQVTASAHYISAFTASDNGPIAGFWYKGHDVTPVEAQAIIRLVKGEVVSIETEAIEETEETDSFQQSLEQILARFPTREEGLDFLKDFQMLCGLYSLESYRLSLGIIYAQYQRPVEIEATKPAPATCSKCGHSLGEHYTGGCEDCLCRGFVDVRLERLLEVESE